MMLSKLSVRLLLCCIKAGHSTFSTFYFALTFISPNSHPSYDPNSCRQGGVNEVYSAVSGPPVSLCFLCAYISRSFLLLLTFKDLAALSGLMDRRRHQLFTHSPNK